MTSAYLNALHEEGSREDLLREVGRLYGENERLRAKVRYLEEVVKAQSVHMHPDASGSYSGTGSAY